MAKSTMSRHSKTSRKPVTIDLDPSDVKPVRAAAQTAKPKSGVKAVPPAEPVGDPVKTAHLGKSGSQTAAQSATPDVKTEAPASPRAEPDQTQSPPQSQLKSPAPSNHAEKTMNSSRNIPDAQPAKTASPWLAGLAGGALVLVGVVAMEWSGYELLSGKSNTGTDPAITAQVTRLEQQLAALQSAPKPDADLMARLETAEKNAAALQRQIAAVSEKLDTQPAGDDSNLRSEFTALQEQVADLKNTAPAADQAGLDALAQRFADMEAKLTSTNTQLAQTTAALGSDDNSVKALQTQLTAVQEKLDNQAKQPDMAAIVAANALKATIDRGGSYSNELQTFASLAPAMADKLQSLETMAATGVPTLNQLAAKFPVLADAMVATENKPAADSGVWDQLIGSVKGLVRSRPIGDIEGDDIGPVVARIEFALQHDDVQRALAEWAKLPESAKQLGQSFYDELLARHDADALMAGLIADVAQSKTAVTPAAD